YKGKTIRFRVATTNNRGKLIVGVDNVKLTALYSDTTPPVLSGLKIRNPSALASPTLVDPTTDTTIVGNISDNGSINNLSFVEFVTAATATSPATSFKINTWDALGNFVFS